MKPMKNLQYTLLLLAFLVLGGATATLQAQGYAKNVELKISASKTSFALGEPVSVNVSLKNKGATALQNFPDLLDPEYRFYQYSITDPKGKVTPFRAFMFTEVENPYITLAASQEVSTSVYLFYGGNGATFPTAGTYKIQVSHQDLKSNILTLTITAPSAADKAASNLMLTDEVGLFLWAGGGHTLTQAVTNLEMVAKDHGSTIFANYANAGLGVFYGNSEVDWKNNKVLPADPEKSKIYLEKARTFDLGGFFRINLYQTLTEDYLKLNDKVKAGEVLKEFETNFQLNERAKLKLPDLKTRVGK